MTNNVIIDKVISELKNIDNFILIASPREIDKCMVAIAEFSNSAIVISSSSDEKEKWIRFDISSTVYKNIKYILINSLKNFSYGFCVELITDNTYSVIFDTEEMHNPGYYQNKYPHAKISTL